MLPGQSATVPMGVGFVYSIPLQIKESGGVTEFVNPTGDEVEIDAPSGSWRARVLSVDR
jgi:hypothetical protein